MEPKSHANQRFKSSKHSLGSKYFPVNQNISFTVIFQTGELCNSVWPLQCRELTPVHRSTPISYMHLTKPWYSWSPQSLCKMHHRLWLAVRYTAHKNLMHQNTTIGAWALQNAPQPLVSSEVHSTQEPGAPEHKNLVHLPEHHHRSMSFAKWPRQPPQSGRQLYKTIRSHLACFFKLFILYLTWWSIHPSWCFMMVLHPPMMPLNWKNLQRVPWHLDFLSYENGVGAVFMYEYVVQSLGHKCLRSNYVYKAQHPCVKLA